MKCNLNWLCAITILLAGSAQSQAQSNTGDKSTTEAPASGDYVYAQEVVVESSLNVRKPSGNERNRRVRNVLFYLVPKTSTLIRAKRQFPAYNPGFNPGFNPAFNSGFPANQGFSQPYDNSQSTAQSNSHSNSFGPFGSQNADALAGAQVFQSSGPVGSFGASANNAATNTLNIGPNGASGGVSNAGGQTYQLPGGHSLNIAYNNGFSFGPNGRPSTSQSNSIAITR